MKVVAMILAGGKGTRLESLTKRTSKPAVEFGGKYRIIDFPLSNVANSDINTVGVCTQYESYELNSYIGNGEKWGLNGVRSLASPLVPRQTEEGAVWYKGTADAIYQNLYFLDEQKADYVLILSGDHIYSTKFHDMLKVHMDAKADCTISVIEVPLEEASRFGIMSVDENGKIVEFAEKPKKPKSNLASMGIYIFSYKSLRSALILDAKDENSDHDFGKNIIPTMLKKKKKMMSYVFKGYWRDVGTLASLHEANMDLLPNHNDYARESLFSQTIFSQDTYSVPQYIGKKASVSNCVINQGALVLGDVEDSVIFSETLIEHGATLKKCVVMSGAVVKKGAYVENAIIGPRSVIEGKERINKDGKEVVLVVKK